MLLVADAAPNVTKPLVCQSKRLNVRGTCSYLRDMKLNFLEVVTKLAGLIFGYKQN